MVTKKVLSQAEAEAKLKELATNNPHITTQIDPDHERTLNEMRDLARTHEVNKGATAAMQSAPGFIGSPVNGQLATKKFTLGDGRILEMGPSRIPHMLITPAMFNGRDLMDFKFRADLQSAKVMQYVRSLDGVPMAEPLGTWMEVVNLMHNLGEMGCKAANSIYDLYWDDNASAFWSELKN